jgi:MFS family permease
MLFGLGPVVRHNFRWDMVSSVGAGLFTVFTLTFVPVVARRAGADEFVISCILAAQFAGSMLAIFSGHVLPRANRHAVATAMIAVGRGLFLLALVTAGPWPLVGMVLGHWIVVALVTPVMFEVLRDIYPPRQRGRLLGLTRLGLTGSMTIGSLVAGLLLDLIGPNLLLPLGALFGIIGALAWSRLQGGAGTATPPLGLGSVLGILGRDRRFAVFAGGLTVWGLGLLVPGALYPLLLVDRFQATYSEIGTLGLITSATWLLGYLFWGGRIDRWSPVRVVALSFAGLALLPLAYLLSPNVWWLVPGVAAQGFASAGIDLGMINIQMRLAPRDRLPEYASLLTSIAGARGLIAPFLGAALASTVLGPNGVLVLAALMTVAGAIILGRTVLPEEPAAERAAPAPASGA